MAGILYGYRGGLGKAGELFQKTGTTHIIAVSGQNISIVANLLLTTLIFCRVHRKKSFYLICSGIILFVIFTGASSSAVRAGVMAILMLLARQIGRRATGLNLLIFTAVLLVLQNPFILIWDVGFQLSFLSTLGIMLFNPILNFYWRNIPEMLVVKEALVTTSSATIFTLPVILYTFGQISLVSVIVNVLLLWLVPILMFTGFISVLVGLFYFPLGDLLAWLPWLGMKYLFTVVKFFANLKFSSLNFQLPLLAMLAIYLIIFYSARRLSRVINLSL
jgi:competence protein ComEC